MSKVDEERITEILKGRRAVRVVPFPGVTDGQPAVMVGIRVLTGEEVDEARLDAVQYVQGKASARNIDPLLMMQLDAEILDEDTKRALIYRAFVKPEPDPKTRDHAQHFGFVQTVRKLDTVLVNQLHQMYLEHQERVNPLIGDMSDEAVEELADALGKPEEGAIATVILSQFDAPTLRRLLRTTALRLRSLLSGK